MIVMSVLSHNFLSVTVQLFAHSTDTSHKHEELRIEQNRSMCLFNVESIRQTRVQMVTINTRVMVNGCHSFLYKQTKET